MYVAPALAHRLGEGVELLEQAAVVAARVQLDEGAQVCHLSFEMRPCPLDLALDDVHLGIAKRLGVVRRALVDLQECLHLALLPVRAVVGVVGFLKKRRLLWNDRVHFVADHRPRQPLGEGPPI